MSEDLYGDTDTPEAPEAPPPKRKLKQNRKKKAAFLTLVLNNALFNALISNLSVKYLGKRWISLNNKKQD